MQHLLLLHGAIGSADQLKPIAAALENKYIVHTLNFSGHGGEQDIPSFRIESFAADVLNYLHKHNIENIHVFGYSMGGYVALYLAKHHPEKINTVFTLATKFLWTPAIAQQEIKMLDANKITEKIPAFAQILNKRHAPNDWKSVLQKTADLMTALGNDGALKNEDYETIQHPVLIGIGDKDTMVTLEETIGVYRKLKQGNLIVLPQTPHPIEKVAIERITNEIKLFFQ
jgi:pimeloyl-ACP methyl ester carboxylesterase